MNNIPAVNNKGASEAKIMALEQTVSRLDRIVKALSSQLANMQEQYKSSSDNECANDEYFCRAKTKYSKKSFKNS